MSSDFSLTLAQLLPGHHRQVIRLVIRDPAFPHDEDDLQPLRAQGTKRLTIRVAPGALRGVVPSRPLAPPQREERHMVDDVAQRLVAGKAEPDDVLLAAADRHGHRPGLRLQMPKRLPPARRAPQAGPEGGRRDAVVTDRQRPDPLRRREPREKIFDRLAVGADALHHHRQLRHQALPQAGLGPHPRAPPRAVGVAAARPRAPAFGSRSADGRAPTAATGVPSASSGSPVSDRPAGTPGPAPSSTRRPRGPADSTPWASSSAG